MTKLRYQIVDFHVHAFPDELAQRALQNLIATYGVPAITDGTVSGLVEHMKACGVSYSVIQPVATKPSQVKSINEWAASREEPGIISFAAIHPDCENVAEEVERIISLGLPGIKIQANWQGTYVDDNTRMYPIYEAAQGRLIVMFHAGNELAPTEEIRATPERLARVHRDFPNLTMIAAHMGGYLMWDEVETYLLGKNVYFDTSACSHDHFPDERFLKFIRQHDPEHVLFATDSPFGSAESDIQRLQALGLNDTELERIFWRNARELLGNCLERKNPAL